jgi:C1A family cysteine protease
MTSRFAAVVVALCTVAFNAHAADRDVDALNVALRKRGASWFARESAISRLPAAERAALAGVLDEPPPRIARTRAAPADLPTHLDWRDHGGNFVTSVKNQGGCGSCWAFAAVAVAESALLIEHNTPGVDIDLSEQFLVSCAGAGTCLGGVADLSVDILAE